MFLIQLIFIGICCLLGIFFWMKLILDNEMCGVNV